MCIRDSDKTPHQLIYFPQLQYLSLIHISIFKFDGKVIEADQLLAFLVPQEPKPNKQSTIDVTTASLASSYKNDPETPENIARVKSALSLSLIHI